MSRKWKKKRKQKNSVQLEATDQRQEEEMKWAREVNFYRSFSKRNEKKSNKS